MIADGSPDMQEEKKVKIENDYKLPFYYILWVGSGAYSPIQKLLYKSIDWSKNNTNAFWRLYHMDK